MKKIFLLLAASMPLLGASAQDEIIVLPEGDDPVVNIIIGDKGQADDVQIEFVKNAPAKLNDYGLPRFAIVGNDNKFYLGIGAQFLGEAMFDFGARNESLIGFIPSSFVPATPGNGAAFNFSALTSSIVVNAVALPGTKDRVGFFFKVVTHDGGNNYGFHLSHVYATYRGFLVGRTSSLFTDGAAMPFTIDDQGPNGSADYTTFTASYTGNITDNFKAAIAIEQPDPDFTAGREVAYVTQRIPSIPLFLQYEWDGGKSHARMSGVFRTMQYRDLIEAKNRSQLGWGVQLSGLANPLQPLTLYWSATYGRGIGTYLQDDNGLHLNAIPSVIEEGRYKLVKNFGVTGGIKYEFSRHLAVNAMYSHLLNSCPDGARIDGDAYRYGDYVAANVIYTINKIIATGIEYDYGHRKLFNGSSLHSSRIQAQLAITF